VSQEQSRSQTPQHYAELLSSASPDGELPILVGGQAVNLLALLFLEDEPELKRFAPFSSGDCDVYASGNWLRRIAEKHGLPYKIFRAGQASPAVGWIRLPTGESEIELQVLRDVLGLTREEVEKTAFSADLDGKLVHLLNPTTLLKAKIANLCSLPQKDRYDLHHVRILIPCVRAALKVQIAFLEEGKIAPQKCIKAFEAVVKLITSKEAKAVAKKFGIDLKQAIPTKEISGRKETQFVNFVEHRLSRI
jgi:hypothetical protein